MITRLRQRQEMRFFAALWKASPGWTAAWWLLIVLRGALPTLVSVAFGWLISAITRDVSLTWPLVVTGIAFVVLVVLQPIHELVSSNLGSRMSGHLYDRLMAACVQPPGMGHLESPELMNDLTMARDFDLGMMGPPLAVSMSFIASGLLDVVVGVVAAIALFWLGWWPPLVLLIAWFATHWLLRESGVWKDRNTDQVRSAQRHADYAYRLAVDPGPAKELRYFGLAGWVTERFVSTRRRLYDLQYEATKLREKSVLLCLAVVAVANIAVCWFLASKASDGSLSSARTLILGQAIIGVASIAFGGLNWALDGAASPVAALARLEAAAPIAGALGGSSDTTMSTFNHAPELRFDGVDFAYVSEGRPILNGFNLTIPAGSSIAIVGQNGAGKTTLAKLLCRLYDPTAGAILVDGKPLHGLDADQWRRHVTAVFQDFVRFELSLRQNVSPTGAPDEVIRAALADAGAGNLADGDLDTVLSKGYAGGTDLSGGQWQRVALARALCAVRQGAKVVLLDEPTAQLDVRGEAEIFERVLAATRSCTTILISHRFSTVRLADRICVLEAGQVVELGTHDELIQLGGRYRTMFELQASRFGGQDEVDEHGQKVVYESLGAVESEVQ